MATINIGSITETNLSVSENMFGTNYLARHYNVDDKLQDVLETLNVTTLRYPGGEITESSFSIYDPDRTTDDQGRTITPLSDFIDFCIRHDYSFVLVLPTRDLLSSEFDKDGNRFVNPAAIADTVTFVSDLLVKYAYLGADKLIDTLAAIEIGNEYWSSSQMTGTEYGRIIDALAPDLYHSIHQQLGLAAADEIDLLVQMGGPWSRDYDTGGRINSITSSSPTDLIELALNNSFRQMFRAHTGDLVCGLRSKWQRQSRQAKP